MIASFSLQESPYAAVVLLDSSGSMEARFSLARSAAIRFLDGLRPEDVAAVYRFDSKVERVQEFSGGRDLAPMAYAIRAKGMTTLNDAIVEASKTLAERPEHRKAIVILSDGMDTYSKASSEKAVESALAVGARFSRSTCRASRWRVPRTPERGVVERFCGEDWREICFDARWTSVARCVHRYCGRVGPSVHDCLSSAESKARWEVARN